MRPLWLNAADHWGYTDEWRFVAIALALYDANPAPF